MKAGGHHFDASRKTRILVVDDHEVVRQGLKHLIEQEPDLSVCAEADSASRALQAIEQLKPDLVIVDVALKGPDGLQLIKWIRTSNKDLPILVLSMHDEQLYADRVLRAGANGYLMKTEAGDKIINGIRKILKGEIYYSEAVGRNLIMEAYGRGDTQDMRVRKLSDRELQVFRLIGQGYGTSEIASMLSLSIKTIETYRAHIKRKLGLTTANQLVRYAARFLGP